MPFSLLLLLLFSVLQLQLITSSARVLSEDCKNVSQYVHSYNENNAQEFKVLDALRAEEKFISIANNFTLLNMFRPRVTAHGRQTAAAAIKSIIELVRIKEINRDPLVQLLLSKVAEDSCKWLNESPDIETINCTNIDHDLPQLEELYRCMDLYDTLLNTREAIQGIVNDASVSIHYCAWINNRIPGNCDHGHRSTLNRELCNSTTQLQIDCGANAYLYCS